MVTVGTPTPITSTRTTTGTPTTRGKTYTPPPEIKGGSYSEPQGRGLPVETKEEEKKEEPLTPPQRGKVYAPEAADKGTKATISRPINDLSGSYIKLSPVKSQELQFRQTPIGQAIQGADIRNWPRIIKQGPQSEGERYGATLSAFSIVAGGAAGFSGYQIPASIPVAKTAAQRIGQGALKDIGLYAGTELAGKYVIQPAIETQQRLLSPELRKVSREQAKSAEIIRVEAEQKAIGSDLFKNIAYSVSQGLTSKDVKQAGIKASSEYIMSQNPLMTKEQAEKAATAQRKASVYGEATNLVAIGAASNRRGAQLLKELGKSKTIREAAFKSFVAVGRAGAFEGAATATATQRYRPTLDTPQQKSFEIAVGTATGAISAGVLGSIQGKQAFKRSQPIFSKTKTILEQKVTTTAAYLTDPFEAQGDLADDLARNVENKLKNIGKGKIKAPKTYAFVMPKIGSDTLTKDDTGVFPTPETTPQTQPKVTPLVSTLTAPKAAPFVNPKTSPNTFVQTMVNINPKVNTNINTNPLVSRGFALKGPKKLSFNMPSFGGRSQFRGKGAKTFYVPSLTAMGLGIKGKVTQKKFSGIELRPIKG